jgi:hypothetical protein
MLCSLSTLLSPDRLISSLITLIWFVTANILVYTSIDTCRYDAPPLWWLNFAILCILYLMVLEVVVLGFVVLIVAPILFVSFSSSKLRSRLTSKTLTDLLEHIPDMHWLPPDAKSDRDQTRDRQIIEVDRRQHSSLNYIPAPPLDDTGKETLSAPQLYPPKPTKQRMRFRLLQNLTFLTSRFSSDEIEFCAPNTLGSSCSCSNTTQQTYHISPHLTLSFLSSDPRPLASSIQGSSAIHTRGGS